MKTKVYGEELRKQILARKQRMLDAIADRQKRIDDGWTDMDDCFMSQRIEERAISEADKQLRILEGDGTMEWNVIVDENGHEVNVRNVRTRYGWAYVGRGIFASSTRALCKKTGWKETTKQVPVWTKFVSNGTGLCGAYCGSIQVVRWHTNMVTGEYVGYPE